MDANLKPSILSILNACFHPDGYVETGLRGEVDLRLKRPAGDQEWDRAIAQLRCDGLVKGTPDDLTGDQRYQLTEAGRALVKARKL